jgi:hypothetical protein
MNALKLIVVIYAIIIVQKIYVFFVKIIYATIVHINVNIADILIVKKRIAYQNYYHVKNVKI